MDSENKEEIPVHEEFILCCGAETLVIKCGPWTDLINDQSGNRPKLLIFLITGNPGFASLYIPFLKALYSSTNKRFPVWTISHAGHVIAPKDKTVTASDESNAQEVKDIYGLSGQIEHKLAFLRAHVPKDMKLVIICHSIGCYMALRILKIAPELQIIRTFLLFPTIERMSECPNGRIATPLLCWLRYVLYATDYMLLKPCPAFIKSFLIKAYFWFINVEIEKTDVSILEPFCVANAMYLGGQEMMEVVERDNEIIKEHLSKLTFYYGTIDHWCPVSYYEDIKKDFPEGDIRLCKRKIPHAFLLSHSQEMATMVADWLKDDLSKI